MINRLDYLIKVLGIYTVKYFKKGVYMAKIIENLDGKRKLVKLSTDDILSVVREYQRISYGCKTLEEIRSNLSDTVLFLPEEF